MSILLFASIASLGKVADTFISSSSLWFSLFVFYFFILDYRFVSFCTIPVGLICLAVWSEITNEPHVPCSSIYVSIFS